MSRYGRYGGSGHSRWPTYTSVGERRARAEKKVAQLRKKGQTLKPVVIEGRAIAQSFWGKRWCENLESYSDYANRLPRGRSYARHGSVIDLQIAPGRVTAQVYGTSLYRVAIEIAPVDPETWRDLRERSVGQIDSVVELLAGELSQKVMEIVGAPGALFPSPKDIKLSCSCPDWAVMCKHVAATLYGVGARLDDEPGMLFTLRGVDPDELVEAAINANTHRRRSGRSKLLDTADLSDVFGVDLGLGGEGGGSGAPAPRARARRAPKRSSAPKKATTPRKPSAPKRATTPRKPSAPKRATPPRKPSAPKRATPLSLPPRAAQVFALIGERPGLRAPELAAELGVSRSAVSNAITHLRSRALVVFVGANKSGGYWQAEPKA